MHRGWLLFALSSLLAAGALVTGVAGLAEPPLLVLSVALASGSYTCWSRARTRLVADVYERVGVEPNPDGTVGDEGARASRTRTGRVSHEPQDDWDDPDDWPFEGPFWTDEGARGGDGASGDGSRIGDPGGDVGDGGPTRESPRESHRGDRHGFGDPRRGPGTRGATRGSPGVRTVTPREREACEVLDVPVDASAAEVRAAYRERVKEVHPDRGGSEAAFKRVRRAYEHLRTRRE